MKESYKFQRTDNGRCITRKLTLEELFAAQYAGSIYRFADGVEARRMVAEEMRALCGRGEKRKGRAWSKPLLSDAASVSDGAEGRRMNQEVRAAGISGVRYCEKTGDCYFESRSGRNKEMTRRGFRDKDAGYGDVAGRVG